MVAETSVSFAGLKFSNPFQAASGVLGASASLMIGAFSAGAGCVVSKSVGLASREGFCGPNVVVENDYVINAMGLPNPGVDEMIKEIEEARNAGVRVIGSVYGFSPEEYTLAAERLASSGVEAVELNLSCPTVRGTGLEIGQTPELVRNVVEAVKSRVKKPVIAKLTPNVTDIVEVGKAAVDAGADALTAIDTLRGMAIDADAMRPILSTGIGGVSGPAVKPVAVRCVYELYASLDVPVIGCGGVVDANDAVEFFLAGASAVQVGTGILYQDLGIFKKLNDGIRAYLKKKDVADLTSLIGKAHRSRS